MIESHPDKPDIVVHPLFGEKIGKTLNPKKII